MSFSLIKVSIIITFHLHFLKFLHLYCLDCPGFRLPEKKNQNKTIISNKIYG
jgi:hypothetical protein